MYFVIFVIISPWKKAGLSFEQTLIPLTQEYFLSILVEIGPVVLEEKIFKFHLCIYVIPLLTPLGKRMRSFSCANLNPLCPRILFARFEWNWPHDLMQKL